MSRIRVFILLARVMTVRVCAALVALVTSAVALQLLPSSQYALASLSIAVSAIFTQLFYLPFSKFALISNEPMGVSDTFLRSQSLVVIAFIVGVPVIHFFRDGYPLSLGVAGAFFAVTQGWKEFCGEQARATNNIVSMQRLYLFDALTTLALTSGVLLVRPLAEYYILASAISSIFWSIALMPRPLNFHFAPDWSGMWRVYRYSFGLVGANVMNSTGLALGRAAILHVSPVASAGATQFLLDILQKIVALLGSSLISIAVPEVKRSCAEQVVRWLMIVMFGVLFSLLCAMGALVAMPAEWKGELAGVSLATSYCCAFFIWANRYKSTVMDAALMSSEAGSAKLLSGGAVALLAIYALSKMGESVSVVLLSCGVAILIGGAVNVISAKRFGVLQLRMSVVTVAAPCAFVLMLIMFLNLQDAP